MHNEAIRINPLWSEQDRANAREMLIHKIAKVKQMDVEQARQKVTFSERVDYGKHKLLVATLEMSE